jgi:hypothetical protein
MSKFFKGIKGSLKAEWWSGASWLMTLCVIQLLVGIFYIYVHHIHPGEQFVQLETDQTKTLNDLLSIYPDSQLPTSLLKYTDSLKRAGIIEKKVPGTIPPGIYDSIASLRKHRAAMVKQFLRTAYKGNLCDSMLNEMDSTLLELNTRDAGTYITTKKFKVKSYFWLAGNLMYCEALLWSFIGVISSLIYYVSLANQLARKGTEDDDIGPFDTSEISAQVAKMFYAPAITLVLVIGYNYFSGKNEGMINISVNNGLILFAFIAGFYSGRLMKLLDSLKNLILPTASDAGSKKTDGAAATGVADITVQVGLNNAVAASPDGPGIIEAGFNAATVTLEPAGKPGNSIPLNKPAEDQGGVFSGSKIPYGKYTLKARYAYKNQQTIINLAASQDIEISKSATAFTLVLDRVKEEG